MLHISPAPSIQKPGQPYRNSIGPAQFPTDVTVSVMINNTGLEPDHLGSHFSLPLSTQVTEGKLLNLCGFFLYKMRMLIIVPVTEL